MTVLVVVEHDRGTFAPATDEALTVGARIAAAQGVALHAITIGAAADGLASSLGDYGVTTVHQAHHALLTDYGPEAWATVVTQLVASLAPSTVLATGTDRGNEILAHVAALLDVPMMANVLELDAANLSEMTRMRWGGSLLERASITGGVTLFTVSHHSVEVVKTEGSPAAAVVAFAPALDVKHARTMVVERAERVAGVTLATAPVVVSGGRGVGSPEAFAPLEKLAGMLGGVVGCSRAVTNNGWRPHTDQVGQTGTRIAPEIYIACGISGAIQHWVGAMASKKILAINTDKEANMVAKADYAVIGDLHQVIPAVIAELERRRGWPPQLE